MFKMPESNVLKTVLLLLGLLLINYTPRPLTAQKAILCGMALKTEIFTSSVV
jgi:hypothetical protein